MAQWRKIQSLANSRAEVYTRLNMMYNNQDRKGLLDIRQWCSEWIEKIDWYAAIVGVLQVMRYSEDSGSIC